MKKFVLTIYCPNTLGMVLYETVDGASLVYFTGLFWESNLLYMKIVWKQSGLLGSMLVFLPACY